MEMEISVYFGFTLSLLEQTQSKPRSEVDPMRQMLDVYLECTRDGHYRQ